MQKINDKDRLEFIKQKIKYTFFKANKPTGNDKFINDLVWLIDMAEKGIKKGK